MKDIKTCSRPGCYATGTNKSGNATYCPKHYRIRFMRKVAKRDGKVVPTWEQCEEMLIPCLDEHGNLGKCPCCKRQMQWKATGKSGKKGTTISLQHNHDGSMCFICLSCNIAHGHSKLGDGFFDIPEDHKYCPICGETKPISNFYRDRSKSKGSTNRCKVCNRKYEAAKRQEVLA